MFKIQDKTVYTQKKKKTCLPLKRLSVQKVVCLCGLSVLRKFFLHIKTEVKLNEHDPL